MQTKLPKSSQPETIAAQALGHVDPGTNGVVPGIQLSTTYERNDDYSPHGDNFYIRLHGPNQAHAAQVVCALEGGQDAMTFGSGLGACTAPFHALKFGDRVAVSKIIYHGVITWLDVFAVERGLKVDYFDVGDLEQLAAITAKGDTKLVWLETPANPTWAVTDIAEAARIAHEGGALLAVDSTAATPVLTRPIELGADLVCHSATKYLGGHSDVLAGVLVTADAASDIWQRIRHHQVYGGGVLGAFDAYMLTRGIKTLFLRVAKASENAMSVARYLNTHENIDAVHYPGLQSFPGHAIAASQMKGGFGGMLSFQVPGGRKQTIARVMKAKVFKCATSLGSVESLIEHRKSSESENTTTPENLVRVSVGIESIDDLLSDLEQMLS
ncbi:MAG: cystathionine gamma-synthase [Paracoccaceae bacterium]|jgi:cystathionine gamma-synthase